MTLLNLAERHGAKYAFRSDFTGHYLSRHPLYKESPAINVRSLFSLSKGKNGYTVCVQHAVDVAHMLTTFVEPEFRH